MALSGDGRRALSGSDDQTLKLWDLESGQCLRTLTGHTGKVRAVALSGDGRRVLSESGDRTLKLRDLDVSSLVPQAFKLSQPQQFAALQAQHDALRAGIQHIATLCAAGKEAEAYHALQKLWAPLRFRREPELERLYGQLRRQGRLGEVLATQERSWTAHQKNWCAVALSDDGRRALSGSGDHTLKLWDLESGQCLRTLTGHTDQVFAVTLSGKGTENALGSL